jgi:hypothetical protein
MISQYKSKEKNFSIKSSVYQRTAHSLKAAIVNLNLPPHPCLWPAASAVTEVRVELWDLTVNPQ